VGKFNVRTSRSIPSKYRIQFIPTIIIFKNGEIVEQFIGLTGKDEISDAIRKALEGK
jgi:thioredoxin 1